MEQEFREKYNALGERKMVEARLLVEAREAEQMRILEARQVAEIKLVEERKTMLSKHEIAERRHREIIDAKTKLLLEYWKNVDIL